MYKCEYCDEIFNDVEKYREHLYLKHRMDIIDSMEFKFKCKYCEEMFDDGDEYVIHLRKNHYREIAEEYNILDEIVDELIDGSGKFAKKILMRKQTRRIFKWFVGIILRWTFVKDQIEAKHGTK